MAANECKSTFTPLEHLRLPSAPALRDEFIGRPLSSLRTPAAVIDRAGFVANCADMARRTAELGLAFRAHIKTHKTPEGTRLQVEAGARALVASTMPEIWGVLESGLILEGKVDDILYSLPISADRMEDLTDAQEKAGPICALRVMVDHPDQVSALSEAYKRLNRRSPWSVFIKVDGGGRRAGAPPRSEQMRELVLSLLAAQGVEVFGFYSHFGHSYRSTDLASASAFYAGEIECVNDAAAYARELGLRGDFVLSVGATPTAHAASSSLTSDGRALEGKLELHAGCYTLNDLQQAATGLVTSPRSTALSVLTTVVSTYAHRGEAVCDAGALAVSKDTGSEPGYGRVTSHNGWALGRVSQEHGVLVHAASLRGTTGGEAGTGNGDGDGEDGAVADLKIGDRVRFTPQHACLVCACFPWIYVVDGGDTVVDVWVPWKGW